MNREWIGDELESFIDLCNKYIDEKNSVGGQVPRNLTMEIHLREPIVRKIIETLNPSLLEDFDIKVSIPKSRNAALRAAGFVEKMDEWAEHLSPDAPSLPADQFHPWVWDSARTLWESKHYRVAVEAATNAVNAFTQTKVERRDISGTELMNQAFTDKPKPGQKVLRYPGDPLDETVKNRNRALRPFAEGCFAGIRNPATHEHGPDWDEQTALEYLAALSVLARWIDKCDVIDTP